jgi:hypothetical protein
MTSPGLHPGARPVVATCFRQTRRRLAYVRQQEQRLAGGAAFGARRWRGPVRGGGAKPACSCKPCASCSTRSLIDQ